MVTRSVLRKKLGSTSETAREKKTLYSSQIALSFCQFLRNIFVPEDDLPKEYWRKRSFDAVCSVCDAIKSSLTSRAVMAAMGVGNADASPVDFIVISEVASAVAKAVGLSLSSVLPSKMFAANARNYMLLVAFVGRLPALCHLLLVFYPSMLATLTILDLLLQTVINVMQGPANACLWNHLNSSSDARKRADISSKTSNQDKIVLFGKVVLQWSILSFVHFSNQAILLVWTAVSIVQIAAEVQKALCAAQPTFNLTRASLTCTAWCSTRAIPAPCEVARSEPLLPCSRPWYPRFGVAVDELLPPIDSAQDHQQEAAKALVELLEMQAEHAYVLGGCVKSRTLRVGLREGAGAREQMRAALHAHLAAHRLSALASPVTLQQLICALRASSQESSQLWPSFWSDLQASAWNPDAVLFEAEDWRLGKQSRVGPKELEVLQSISILGRSEVRRWSVRDTLQAADAGAAHKMSWWGWRVCSRACAAMAGALVPRGFPDSVAPEYLRFQAWDTAQGLAGELRSVLISHAALAGMGVGVAGADPHTAVCQDLAVSLWSALLGLCAGALLDPSASARIMKRWRLYRISAELLAALAALLMRAFPHHRLVLRGLAVGLSSAVGSAGVGAEQAVVAHLSNYNLDAGFRADVAAKEGNQDRALALGLVLGRLSLLRAVGGSALGSAVCVVLLSGAHILCSLLAMRCLVVPLLNDERLRACSRSWLASRSVPSTHEGAAAEPLFPRSSGWRVEIGAEVGDRRHEAVEAVEASGEATQALDELLEMQAEQAYVLGGCVRSRTLRVGLREGAGAREQMRAALHAHLAAHRLLSCDSPVSLDHLIAAVRASLADLPDCLEALESGGWNLLDCSQLPVGSPRLPLGSAKKTN